MSTLDDFRAAVANAQAQYLERRQITQAARSAESDALNELNEAQKRFDAEIEKIKSEATSDSVWAMQRRRGFPAAGG